MGHSFLIHHRDDDVAVAIEDVSAGREAVAVAMDSGERVAISVRADVPLGHKVALKDLNGGDAVRKYGLPIGRLTTDVRAGDLVHTHNLRSARW